MADRRGDSGDAESFEGALGLEILASERRRMTILAAVLGGALLFWIATGLVLPASVVEGTPFALEERRRVVITLLAAAFLYELIARRVMGCFIRSGRRPRPFMRFGNCMIETSLPALVTVGIADLGEPAYALLLPPTWFFFLFILLSTLRLDFWLALFTGAVAAAEYAALAIYYVGSGGTAGLDPLLTSPVHHGGKAILLLGAGLLAGLVALQIRQQFANSLRSVEERNRVVNMFGQHVSPAVVDRLMTQEVELGGETRHVCVMFLDIRGFTSFSERRKPEDVVEYLNTLFEFMVESVNRYGGIVNKFLGDGFMAVFGAPISNGQDCQSAVAAAREIVAKVEELNAAGSIPPTRIGIGLHAGEAVTGNVGSPLRKEYTIIGDTVNLAARIEQLNKQFGSRLLLSRAVLDALDGEGRQAEALGPVAVRGVAEPVAVYRLA